MGLFDRLKSSLRKTRAQLVGRVDEIAGGGEHDGPARSRSIAIDTLDELEEALISADVGVAAADRIVSAVRERAAGGVGDLRRHVRDEILHILEQADRPVWDGVPPRVMLVVGVNGTGKTTTVGKLANLFRNEGGAPLVCAADTFRAAAVEQLEVWAGRAGVDFVRAGAGADPAAVVFDAVKAARARRRSPVIVDTAGRLHTRVNLMSELDKIRRIAGREVDGAPHDVLLVLDATVGQNGLSQARQFVSVAGVNGIVLTKLDGTARGGIAVAVASDLQVPLRYIGTGESLDDLVPFSPRAYVDALFEESW